MEDVDLRHVDLSEFVRDLRYGLYDLIHQGIRDGVLPVTLSEDEVQTLENALKVLDKIDAEVK